jgi:hypothetical protein
MLTLRPNVLATVFESELRRLVSSPMFCVSSHPISCVMSARYAPSRSRCTIRWLQMLNAYLHGAWVNLAMPGYA